MKQQQQLRIQAALALTHCEISLQRDLHFNFATTSTSSCAEAAASFKHYTALLPHFPDDLCYLACLRIGILSASRICCFGPCGLSFRSS